MEHLYDLYKKANVAEKEAELSIIPFEFDTVLNDNHQKRAKGHDGVLYDACSEAAFYSVIGADHRLYRVFAFIGKPKTPAPKGGYPAIVLAHGGCGIAYFEWVEHWVKRGYVAIAPDLGGHYAQSGKERRCPNQNGSPQGEVEKMGSFFETDDLKSSWMYFSVFALGTAINAMKEYADINENKIAIAGISFGGVLALHAAGIEARFNAASIIYSSAYITYTKWSMEENNVKSLNEEQLGIYREYLDPCCSLEYITCPILFTAGMDDAAFTMLNRKQTTEKITSDKKFAYHTQFPHGHWEGWTPLATYEFMDGVLGVGRAVSDISLDIDAGSARVELYGNTTVKAVYLCYTVETIDRMENCAFEEIPLEKQRGEYTAKIPENTTACFARYETENGASFSTDIQIL